MVGYTLKNTDVINKLKFYNGIMNEKAIIIFAKEPIVGGVKTRLGKTIGMDKAARIYEVLLKNTLDTVSKLHNIDVHLFITPDCDSKYFDQWVYEPYIQRGNDLGKRMENAFEDIYGLGYKKIVIIGTDCPTLTTKILNLSFSRLEEEDVVIGPSVDGGYYLLGMNSNYSFLFKNIEWSTNQVLSQTKKHIRQHSLGMFQLPRLRDIDEEQDLKANFQLIKNTNILKALSSVVR